MTLALVRQPTVVRDPQRASHIAEILKAVAHPVRLQLVALLCEAPAHVKALAEVLDQPQAIVSQQLRILRFTGLVSVRRAGGLAVYSLAEPQLRNLVACMDGCALAHAPRTDTSQGVSP